MKPKISIVVSCTAGKNLGSCLEFDHYHPDEGQAWWSDAHNCERMRAEDLYKGPGADKFRAIKKLLEEKYEVTLYILSAGFGVVHGDRWLPGYDATFSSMASRNRVKPAVFKQWLTGVTMNRLPKGSIIMLPNSYLKPFKAIENLEDHIQLGPFGGEVREHYGWSMIRTQLNACELIVKEALEKDIPAPEWSSINPLEL